MPTGDRLDEVRKPQTLAAQHVSSSKRTNSTNKTRNPSDSLPRVRADDRRLGGVRPVSGTSSLSGVSPNKSFSTAGTSALVSSTPSSSTGQIRSFYNGTSRPLPSGSRSSLGSSDGIQRATKQPARTSYPLVPITPSGRNLNRNFAGNLTGRMVVQGNFSQPFNPITSQSTQAQRRQPIISHMTPSVPKSHIVFPSKSVKPILPTWQVLDEEYEATNRPLKRQKPAVEGEFVSRRITMSSGRPSGGRASAPVPRRISDPGIRPKTYLGTGLVLREDGDGEEESRMDIDAGVRHHQAQPQRLLRNLAKKVADQLPMVAKKSAARKSEIIDVASSEDEDEASSSSLTESSEEEPDPSESEREIVSHEQQLRVKDEDVDMDLPPRQYGPAEIIYLDSPPPITIALPETISSKRPAVIDAEQSSPEIDDKLLSALKSLTVSTVLMKKHQKLPFLRRNLRAGFEERCRALNIRIHSKKKEISFIVRYDYVNNVSYEKQVSFWLCPLCPLHGKFKTREMLAFHLDHDHQEVFVEWVKPNIWDNPTWRVQILIPETPVLKDRREDSSSEISLGVREAAASKTPAKGERLGFRAPRPPSSPLSPTPELHPRIATPIPASPKQPNAPIVPTSEARPNLTQLLPTRSTTATSVTRSTTATSSTSATTAGRARYQNGYPASPPPDDPLGPAARPPYFPAVSEYGGPTVYYSCRPGGPCLYDLLNTLPMEKFGILAWAVLDREEEIYQTDDVKEEYKVMHALWARWIILNRNKFIADYYKGTIAFIDEYWKMIHRAAGWNALRYWLLILLKERFLTGRDVAKGLKHYEKHTGMEFW